MERIIEQGKGKGWDAFIVLTGFLPMILLLMMTIYCR